MTKDQIALFFIVLFATVTTWYAGYKFGYISARFDVAIERIDDSIKRLDKANKEGVK